jgi:hypothetical protein
MNIHGRTRAAVFIVSLASVVLQLAMVRELAWRFWEHAAWLVISMAMLGFGASGTLLVLGRRFCSTYRRWFPLAALLGFGAFLPVILLAGDALSIDLIQMVWQPSLIYRIAGLEMVMAWPFLCVGFFIGLAMEDDPRWVSGHYAASFIGSAFGGVVALPAMMIIPPRSLIFGCSVCGLIAAWAMARGRAERMLCLVCTLIWGGTLFLCSPTAPIMPDKDFPQVLAMPQTTIKAQEDSPLGLVHLMDAPAVHAAPGIALNYTASLPASLQVLIDGQTVGQVYRVPVAADWEFMDYTTLALPYHLGTRQSILIADAKGGEAVGLALYHDAGVIHALEPFPAIAAVLHGKADYSHFNDLSVTPVVAELRGYLHRRDARFDLIQLPVIAADRGGLAGALPSNLLTEEAFGLCLTRLNNAGLLSCTVWVNDPPRGGLRLIDTAAQALRRSGREPRDHLLIIRSWATLTVVLSEAVIPPEWVEQTRTFCERRGFDLVQTPGLKESDINLRHRLPEPVFYHGALQLTGIERQSFLNRYPFSVESCGDDRPFFHHFSRLRSLFHLDAGGGRHSRAYLELSSIFLLSALLQAVLLAAVLIPLPLIPAIGLPSGRYRRAATLGFFMAIGIGFMMLEVGFLQRLTLYLSHPVMAAAVVIAGFLFFAGVGSMICARFQSSLIRIHVRCGIALVVIGSVTLLSINPLLDLSVGLRLPLRIWTALALIAPVALLMGMMLPLGIRRLAADRSILIPWAWGINGFASVLATLAAPLIALELGYSLVGWLALGCYAAATALARCMD